MIPIGRIDVDKLQEAILNGIQYQSQYVKIGSYLDASIICEYANGQPIFLFEAYLRDGVYVLYPFKVLFKGATRSKQFVSLSSVCKDMMFEYIVRKY